MKLRNKKTDEIVDLSKGSIKEICFGSKIQLQAKDIHNKPIWIYNSLAELNEIWEDYKEPKYYWYIDDAGVIQVDEVLSSEINMRKSIGNYFEIREEAEKAVEKLKAIQRLKNYYLKFKLDFVKNKIDFTYRIDGTLHSSIDEERIIFEDLALLFGGEE